MSAARMVRSAALVWAVGGVALPLAILALWSVSGSWFYPALLPRSWTLESWRALLSGGSLAHSALVSVAMAAVTGFIGCIIAIPVGRLMASSTGWRRHVGVAAAFLPVATPAIALGAGLQYSFIVLGLAGSPAGVVCAHLVPAVGYLSLYFFAVFSAFDMRVEEEARSLGAVPAQVWLRVTLPIIRRQLGAAVAFGFLMSWGQFALTLVIGGGVVHTLSLDVFAYLRAGEGRYAATAALLLIVPPMLVLAASRPGALRAEAP